MTKPDPDFRRNEGNEAMDERLTFAERAADALSGLVGSWRFIIAQSIVSAAWIALNATVVVFGRDPGPFILLNLVFSFQAACAAPIIIMSRNRQAARNRKEIRQTHDAVMGGIAVLRDELARLSAIEVILHAMSEVHDG